MPATLKHLVEVRSQLADAVLRYLTQLANKLDPTPWSRGGERIKASEIGVEPFVLTMRKRHRSSRSGTEGGAPEVFVEKLSPMDEIEAERYEFPTNVDEREEERWRSVMRRGRVRLGLKGAPGSGKTFTTRQSVVSLARQAAMQLESQQVGVDEVEIPIWVTAKDLAQAGAKEIEDALLEAMENGLQLKLSPNLRGWLKQRIGTASAFIVVDALDELLNSDRASFEAKARQLDELGARVVTTCRTMHWEERKDWLGWNRLTDLELAPFKRRQQREFTRKFFASSAHIAQSMERLLRANSALRHACTTPLLLTFACLLHEDGKVKEDTTQLYAEIRRKLVCGEWRSLKAPKPAWAGNGVQEEKCFRFLEGIAWGLFSKAPHLNRFTLDDWERAANEALKQNGGAPFNPSNFLEQLEQVGFIVPAGFDGQRRGRCWSFVHRTLLEFLAASALSRMKREIWLAEAKQHFWFQAEWLEVLTFLAGLLDDASPLIEAVEEEQKHDDLFRSMLYLKGRFVGASDKVDKKIVQQVCDQALSFWQETWTSWGDALQKFSLRVLSALSANVIARDIMALHLLTQPWLPDTKTSALALVEIGGERVVRALLTLSSNNDARRTVGEALCRLGDDRGLELLLDIVKGGSVIDQSMAALALCRFADERLTDSFLELTRHPISLFRDGFIQALGHIGDRRVAERLVEMIKTERNDTAVQALTHIMGDEALELLLKLTNDQLDDRNATVRKAATLALGAIANQQAIDRLVELLNDDDKYVRWAAAVALGKIGDERALEPLHDMIEFAYYGTDIIGLFSRDTPIVPNSTMAQPHMQLFRLAQATRGIGARMGTHELLRHRVKAIRVLGRMQSECDWARRLIKSEFPEVRKAAAEVLARRVPEESAEDLLCATEDTDPDVRASIAHALGLIGSKRWIKTLLSLMRDKDEIVRASAAEALRQIAWKHKMPIRA